MPAAAAVATPSPGRGTKAEQNPWPKRPAPRWLIDELPRFLAMTPDQFRLSCGSATLPFDRWRWVSYAQQLVWLFGADEAVRRLTLGVA